MKPFNLEEAKKGVPLYTREGRSARIICYDRIAPTCHTIVALVKDEKGLERVMLYREDGYYHEPKSPSPNDLMMIGEKKQGWIAICHPYDKQIVAATTNIYATKEEVEKMVKYVGFEEPIEIKQIEWEE